MWSSSSIPTKAAWAVLKRDDLESLSPELQEQMKSFYESIPEDQQEKIQALGEAIMQMPPEKQEVIKRMMAKTISHNAKRMPEILEQADPESLFGPQETEPGTFKLSIYGLGHSMSNTNDIVSKIAFVPLIIYGAAVILAADGVNQAAGAEASAVGNGLKHVGAAVGFNDPPEKDAFSYAGGGFAEEAVFQDPFFGTELGRVKDPSWWQTGLALGLGALQGFGPAGYGKAAKVAGKKSTKLAKVKAKKPASTATKRQKDAHKYKVTQAKAKADSAAARAQAKATKFGAVKTGLGRGALTAGKFALGDPASKINIPGPGLEGDAGGANIHGTAGAQPSATGAGSAGAGALGNRAGKNYKDIFDQSLAARREAAGHGAYGTNKGDSMKVGEQLLKEAKERMDKAHCATHKADDCPKCKGKKGCQCGDNTKKGSKKPAHGMIIVLGAQGSGPGPSKDGKRTKK